MSSKVNELSDLKPCLGNVYKAMLQLLSNYLLPDWKKKCNIKWCWGQDRRWQFCVQGQTWPYFILIMPVCLFCETNPKGYPWHLFTYLLAQCFSLQIYFIRNGHLSSVNSSVNKYFNRPTDGESSEARAHSHIENNPQLQLLPTRCQCHPKMESLWEKRKADSCTFFFLKFVLFILSFLLYGGLFYLE